MTSFVLRSAWDESAPASICQAGVPSVKQDDCCQASPMRWSCLTERDAIFALDTLAVCRERVERWKRNTAAEIVRLERELAAAEEFFVPELERWALENPPAKGRSIHLPSGTLSFRKVPGGFRIVDRDAVRAWAERCLPHAIVAEVVERLDVDRIREHHKETGEVPEGADLVDDQDRFYVKG